MNYEEMSDHEINRAVAEALGLILCNDSKQKPFTAIVLTEEPVIIKGKDHGVSYKARDYCNMPDQAWPIMMENKICIQELGGSWEAWRVFINDPMHEIDPSHECYSALRAAMVVFLKIKDNLT